MNSHRSCFPFACILIVSSFLSSDALMAQDPCTDLANVHHEIGEWVVPDGESCSQLEYESKCWGFPGVASATQHGKLNVALYGPFGPGDFSPRSLGSSKNSLPLVSKEARHFGGPSPHAERPTHQGVIDLVTAQPLLQETDFELPFGGATIRHTRTFSENNARHGPAVFAQGVYEASSRPARDSFLAIEQPSRKADRAWLRQSNMSIHIVSQMAFVVL